MHGCKAASAGPCIAAIRPLYFGLCAVLSTPPSMAVDVQPPTFQEALKHERAQFDDCTPCRLVGTCSHTALYSFLTNSPRQRNLCRPRRLHLRLRPLAAQGAGGRHQAEQVPLRHGQQEGRHYLHQRRLCRPGCLQVVCLVSTCLIVLKTVKKTQLSDKTKLLKWDKRL